MTRCHICDADTPDAHEPLLCGSCCDDRVARIIEDLARLDVTAAADLASRLGVPQPWIVKAARSAGRVVWPEGRAREVAR